MFGDKAKLEASKGVLSIALQAGILGKDKDFAVSLLKSYDKFGGLTVKQEVWFHKLAEKYAGGGAVEKPKAAPLAVSSFEGVYALFAAAKAHIKSPKIWLQLASGAPIMLYLSGPNSKAPGTVQVTDGGGFGANKWYGRVMPNGEFQTKHNAPSEITEVFELLKKLAADPAGVATAYGKLTGKCCFCHKGLTDEKSVAAGFGPVCATKFGLKEAWKAGAGVEGVFGKIVYKEKLDAAVATAAKAAEVDEEFEAAAKQIAKAAADEIDAEVEAEFVAATGVSSAEVAAAKSEAEKAADEMFPTENAGKAFGPLWAAKKKEQEESLMLAAGVVPESILAAAKGKKKEAPQPKGDVDYLF